MTKKKSATKKSTSQKPTPKATPAGSGRVIDFNSLLGNYPSIQIGDQTFEGREVNQTEKIRWAELEQSGEAAEQHTWLADALNARGADVDETWVSQWPDTFLVALVKGLHGWPWPGEEGAEGK